MEGTSNPHYYVPQDISASSITFERQPINLYIVSDAFWIFGPDGGEFIKDNWVVSETGGRKDNWII